jgi:SAM-dependent methyltransferase
VEGHPIVAALIDGFMWSSYKLRRRVVPAASGRVLEIGVGTGANFPYYRNAAEVIGVEPDPYMLARARRRVATAPCPVRLEPLRAEELPFPDASFDSAVATWVLCTIPRPERALAELRRVLRPGATLIFIEHVRSSSPGAARLQALLTPAWSCLSGGCHLDRDIIGMIRAAGFGEIEVEPVGRQRWTLSPAVRGTAPR